MGFWSFMLFNYDLLAKQAQKLIEDHSTLLGQIYKSRNFPISNFLDTYLGYTPFMTWYNVLWGHALLSKALCWMIGYRSPKKCVPDPRSQGEPFSSYDDENFRQQFFVIDRYHILTVPLNYFLIDDNLLWHYTKMKLISS